VVLILISQPQLALRLEVSCGMHGLRERPHCTVQRLSGRKER
jgi:hypothetical protein